MHKSENKYVRVSDISAFLYCPRTIYFRHDKAIETDIRSEIFKEISFRLDEVGSEDPQRLKSIIEQVCDDTILIYGQGSCETVAKIREEAYGLIENILCGLKRSGYTVKPFSIREQVFSDRLKLCGVVDKVMEKDGKKMPVIISASKPPENGVYMSDRIRLAAYSLLIGESFGENIEKGAVEYFSGWELREVNIKSLDKRSVFSIRNKVLEIYEGKMPDAHRTEKCRKCEFHEKCNIRASFLDRLFDLSS